MCKNFFKQKKPENGLNFRILGLSLRFLLLSVRSHAGVIELFMLLSPPFRFGVPFFSVRPIVVPAHLSRLLAVIPGPFTAFFVVFGLVP